MDKNIFINLMKIKKGVIAIIGIIVFLGGVVLIGNTQQWQEFISWVKAGDAFNRGTVNLLEENYEIAIEYYNEAISINPNFAKAYYKRGQARINFGQYKKAVARKTYQWGQTLIENSEQKLGQQEQENAFNIYEQSKEEHKKAVTDFDMALKIAPNFAKAYLNRGIAFYLLADYLEQEQKVESYQKATVDISKALQVNYNLAEAYFYQGNINFDLGNYPKAIKDYTQALQNKSKYALAYLKRGNAYSLLGKQEQAINDYKQALQVNLKIALPNDAAAFYVRAEILQPTLLWKDKRLNDYNYAIELNPNLAVAYLGRGFLHAWMGDAVFWNSESTEKRIYYYDMAEEDFSKAINTVEKFIGGIGVELKIDSQTKILTIVKTVNNLPAWEAGIKNGDQIMKINGQNTSNMTLEEATLVLRGKKNTKINLLIAQEGKGEFNIELTRQAIAINPKLTKFYESRAFFRNNIGNKQGAIEDYQVTAKIFSLLGKESDRQRVLKNIQELQQ